MARPVNDDLSVKWKVMLPATVAGRVEFALSDPLHKKPIYGARAKLLTALLEWWVARESGMALPHIPSVSELRSQGE